MSIKFNVEGFLGVGTGFSASFSSDSREGITHQIRKKILPEYAHKKNRRRETILFLN